MQLIYFKYLVRLVALSIVLLNSSSLNAQTLKVLKVKGAVNEPLSDYYVWFEDCSGQLPVHSIYDSLNKGKFKQEKGAKVFNRGLTQCSFWLAVSVQNDTTITLPLLWSFYDNSIEFTLYDITTKGSIHLLDSSSTSQTLSKRSYPVRSISFKFNLLPHEKKVLIVKVHATNSDSIYFPTDITTTEDYLFFENTYSFLIGRYIGYFVFALIFNLLLWIALKNRIHLWHAIYVLSLIGFNLNEFMVDSYFLPEELYRYWIRVPNVILVLLPVLLGMNVMQIFVDQKKDFERLNKIFNLYKKISFLIALSIIISAFNLPNHNIINIVSRVSGNCLTIAGIALILINIIIGILRKHYYTILYSVSATFLLIAFIDYILNNLNIVQLFFIEPGNITVAFAFEILALTVIFVFKYRKEKTERIQALTEIVDIKDNWVKEIIKVQESERQRIARDLHDDVGATLSVLKLYLSKILKQPGDNNNGDYNESLNLINKANNDIRSIAHDLLPQNFTNIGFFASLTGRIHELNNKRITDFNLILEGDESRLSEGNKAIIIYRIVNELVNNIIKHAQASEATIQLAILDRNIQIIIEDNGIGIQQSANKPGIGLGNVNTRIEYLKGTVHFDTSRNGTTIVIGIPLANE